MEVRDSSYLVKGTVVALTVSGLGYVVLSPLYETGAAKYYVPLLGFLDLFVAYSVQKGLAWLHSWIRGMSIGWLAVAVPFWGRSSEFHGEFAAPMLVVESFSVAAGLGLLLLSFTPAYRKLRIAG
ncbi:hypothetical protein ACFFGH_34095 [Lysobacter korlensis]|uniref:Transmembrane protein n=1 Tax=Lysobacter korlensis TaxID=553636 RepID=A0ABV6S0Y8_9GAMM